MQGVIRHNLRPVIPPSWPSSLADLLARCWKLKSAERPSFAEVVKLLRDVDFPRVETVEKELFKSSVINSLPF
jgi:hypothetical protein